VVGGGVLLLFDFLFFEDVIDLGITHGKVRIEI
jgi:hypothetical protein